ncbi:hypothetical protein MR060_12100, partial [bacterium]|nr:hypothetical protein [bacterium]
FNFVKSLFEDFSDFIDLDFQYLVPHPERMVCNIARTLKNANAENKKNEHGTGCFAQPVMVE